MDEDGLIGVTRDIFSTSCEQFSLGPLCRSGHDELGFDESISK